MLGRACCASCGLPLTSQPANSRRLETVRALCYDDNMSHHKTCSFETCERSHAAKGLCLTHYYQQLKGKPLTEIRGYGTLYSKSPDAPCGVEGCVRTQVTKGLCRSHGDQMRRYGYVKYPELDGRSQESHRRRALTDEQVTAVLADDRPVRKIAKEYGVGKSIIGRIKKNGGYHSG